MRSGPSTLRTDLVIHGAALVFQAVVVAMGGWLQNGSLPPLILPVYLILACLTLIRIHERVDGPRWILLPAGIGVLLFGFCLLSEMRTLLWGFSYPRFFPVGVRVLWYQSALLLLHPDMYRLLCRGFRSLGSELQRRGYFGWKSPLLAAGVIAALWLIRNRNISSDGYDWLKYSVVPDQWMLYLREPLGTFILRMVSLAGQKILHWDPYVSIAVLTMACGILTTVLLYGTLRRMVAPAFVGVTLAVIALNGGYAQVFAGNIEIYALLHVGLALFLYASMRYLDDEWPAWAPGVLFGLLFCTHVSAGWWIPSFLALPLVRFYRARTVSRPFAESLLMTLSAAAVVVTFGIILLIRGYGGDPAAMIAHFFSDQVMLVGTDRAMFHPVAAYATASYYLNRLNLYITLIPAAFLLLPIVVISARHWQPVRPEDAWWFSLAGMYIVYSLVWNPDRPHATDWDLFSGLTIPLVGGLAVYLTRLDRGVDEKHFVLTQVAIVSGSLVVMQMLRNHVKVTDWPLFL